MSHVSDTQVVANVRLSTRQPTSLPLSDLYTWVIWQFPRPKDDGLCAAVHPPLPQHDWYPAIIHQKTGKVQVFAHLGQHYTTPEAAVDFFNQNNE